jgi:enoyl-CoA hydratase/carnithine racemase
VAATEALEARVVQKVVDPSGLDQALLAMAAKLRDTSRELLTAVSKMGKAVFSKMSRNPNADLLEDAGGRRSLLRAVSRASLRSWRPRGPPPT